MTIAKFEVCVACACVLVSAPALEKVGDIPVPADGLVVHIDAMTDAALAYHPDGGNYVTNWTSSVGGVNYGNVGAVEGLPYYDPNGMSEGRGAVIFGYANDGATKRPTWISANKSYGMKTVFLLMRLIERGDSNPVQCIDKDGGQ